MKKNYNILLNINSPADLKKLTRDELKALAYEIRFKIIETVSKTGGHLAPSLGVVELTLALHYVFDSPKDKIIWDVGHQAYAHKIITGRRDEFSTLRQYGGISGFPRRSESEHDAVGTGHASTSISYAIGLAEARKKKNEDYSVIAVIGDGSLTGGMAYEALDHGGHIKSNVIIILNDNEMAISRNVGAISSYLGKIRLSVGYRKFESVVESRVAKIPLIGKSLHAIGKNIKESAKQILLPGIIRENPIGMFFEEMGYKYIGPLDGHNLNLLINNLKRAKNVDKPIIIHVLTRKGYGYTLAESSPDKFHGISPFNVKTGEPEGKKEGMTDYSKIFGRTIVQLAKEREDIVAITAAMKDGTGLTEFAENFPDRFYDVGIAEQYAVGLAAALSIGGLKPVVAIYSTFLQRAFDQLIHDIGLQNLGVVFAIDRGGVVGEDGPTHHGAFDLSYLRQIPNFTIMVPRNGEELRDMLKTAVELNTPASIRYPRRETPKINFSKPMKVLKIPECELLSKGEDVLFLAVGTMVDEATRAAEIIARDKISSTVINARFVKPLDEKTILQKIKKHSLVVTLEENVISGGFGSGVLELMSLHKILTPTLIRGIPDRFVSHGATDILIDDLGLSAPRIAQSVLAKMKELV